MTKFRLLVLALGLLPAADLRGQASTTRPAVEHVVTAEALLRAADSLRALAPFVWPGFTLPRRLMISSAVGQDLTLIGETTLTPGFRWLDSVAHLAVYVGPVPDSLAGLRVTSRWNGEDYQLTKVPRTIPDSVMLQAILHEAFHTYQFRKRRAERGVFAGSGSEQFPRRMLDAVAALVLEGELLAEALETTGPRRREVLRRAFAADELRCVLMGPAVCQEVRELERLEGIPDYVSYTMLVLADKLPAAVDRRVLAERLRHPEGKQLNRAYFYTIARAWYTLIEDESPPAWRQKAETRLIADLLPDTGITPKGNPRTDERWPSARRLATELVAAP